MILSDEESALEGKPPMQEVHENTRQLLARLDSPRLCTDFGKDRISREPAYQDLRTIVQQVLVDLHFDLVDAEADPRLESLPQVAGNTTLLRRLFRELLQNSLQFHDGRRALHIRIYALGNHASAEQLNLYGGILIGIDDNGPGIPADQTDRVFQFFEQLVPQSGHTGCGLPLYQGIKDQNFGHIWIESVPAGGCGVRLWFPDPAVVHIMRADDAGETA